MKKILNIALSILLTFTVLFSTCPHEHDDNCGYDPITETGCTHEHTEECFIQPYGGLEPDGDGH